MLTSYLEIVMHCCILNIVQVATILHVYYTTFTQFIYTSLSSYMMMRYVLQNVHTTFHSITGLVFRTPHACQLKIKIHFTFLHIHKC